MAYESDYKFENYTQYYGDIKQVKQIIDACQVCGAKLMLSHQTDYRNLLVQENAICPDCGNKDRKMIHSVH